MIEIKFNPFTYKLTAKGHAGAAPKGEDLVCSAVTALFTSLAMCIEDNSELLIQEPDIVLDEGIGLIACKPKEGCMRDIALMYLPILHGLHFVAEAFPMYVSFNGDRKKENDLIKIKS